MRKLSALGPVSLALLFCAEGYAASPSSQTISVPSAPGTYTYTWTGTAPAGVAAEFVDLTNVAGDSGLGSCGADPTNVTNDVETFKINPGSSGQLSVTARFRIDWQQTAATPDNPVLTDGFPDLAMNLVHDSSVKYSDGSMPSEEIVSNNPQGDYTVLVCSAIAATDTPYTGTLTLTITPASAALAPPSVDAQGLEFSASLVTDLENFEHEPLVTVDPDGTIYTCGPSFSGYPMADIGQASLDGGDQFNRLGDPMTGRMGLMGGGDCAMGTGIERNAQGHYQLAYAGLSLLLQFTVSTSPDQGQTITNVPMSSSTPDVDRQWIAFTDALDAFLTYRLENQGVVQHSSDGGQTYEPAVLVAPFPDRVGPIRSMTKAENPAHNDHAALYFPWTTGNTIAMAISLDAGASWNNCTVAQSVGSPSSLFPAMDHDSAGNVYLAYTDQADYNTYLVAIPAGQLANCKAGSGALADITTSSLSALPRLQMNRDHAVSTIMPWVAAGGAPGRVAVSFYGSPVNGAVDDASLPHVWDVYVAQSLNALSTTPAVAQVKVTSHPLHYDQICIGGTGCTAGGDRSLADFFSIAYNKANGELDLVYNRSGKKAGEGDTTAAEIGAAAFARQIAGPSNGGGVVARNNRQVMRQAIGDPAGDAYGNFAGLVVTPTRVQLPALDITGVSIDRAVVLESGAQLPEGGFTLTIHVQDLSDAALSQALSATSGQSLVWMFYYWQGFEPHAIAATWDGTKFSFGGSGITDSVACATPPQVPGPGGCHSYSLDTPLDGKVDRAAGTLQLTVPLSTLTALADVPPPARSPAELPARAGDRIYSAAAYTFVNLTGTDQAVSQTLMTVDNSPAMDFLIPGAVSKPAIGLPGVTNVPNVKAGESKGVLLGGSLDLLMLLPLLIAGAGRRRKH